MRKKLITPESPESPCAGTWLDLSSLATVEVTSENPGFPVEAAFADDSPSGWRAAGPGEQTIRLVFDEPTRIRRILLTFVEEKSPRTQEFTLRYQGASGGGEIVRQQWTFSPQGSTREQEDYQVDLSQVRALELKLRPDLQPGQGVASLAAWRVA